MNKQHQNSIHRPAARSIPSPFQRRICWYALTGVSFLVMLGIAAFVIFEVVKLLGFLEPVLLPILIAAVIAYLLEPIVSWLVRRRFSRPWAVITVMGAALAILVGFGATILPPLIRQTDELIDNRMELWNKTSELIDSTIEIPFISRTIDSVYKTSLRELNAGNYAEEEEQELRNAQTAREKLGAYMTINSSFYQEKLMTWLTSGGRVLYSSIGIMVSILITPIFAFYFLLEADKIKEKWP
ncbi:AI-2E family transporter, partial [Akkermansia sp.]